MYATERFLKLAHEGALVKYTLQSTEKMHVALDKPADSLQCIHVAGTNGKGSVSYKIARTLEENHYKTALFLSPHIHSFHERISINQTVISEEDAEKGFSKLFEIADYLMISPSFFEYLFLLALLHFKENEVDIAVFETGLGGRLDATNIIHPILSVITSISKDHVSILGDSLHLIAKEKAGIIKPSVPVILGPTANQKIFQTIAWRLSAPIHRVLGTFDDYDLENCAIAEKALTVLSHTIDLKEERSTLMDALPCRFEVHKYGKGVLILDVAHNPSGIQSLMGKVIKKYPEKEIHVLIAFSKGKDYRQILCELEKYTDHVTIVTVDHERLMTKDELKLEGIVSEDLSVILEKKKAEIEIKGHCLVVCGSFFMMHAVALTGLSSSLPISRSKDSSI